MLVLLIGFTVSRPAFAQSTTENKVVVYLFWGDGCPHCASEKPFLEELAANNPLIELKLFEVWYDDANQKLFQDMAKAYGFEPSGVPTTFIGDTYFVGYSDVIQSQISETIDQCLAEGCPDAGARLTSAGPSGGGLNTPEVTGTNNPTQAVTNPSGQSGQQTAGQAAEQINPENHVIDVPLLGRIDLDAQSLALSTLLISFVDGFNPCSLWVLSMLMALVIHTGSRKKILIIGMIFLTVTAGIYALFIAGVFSVLKVISFSGWIQVVVALVAFVFAIINIKDYFWFQEGVSLTISDKNKGGLLKKMRRVLDASDNIWGLIGATVVLAAGVSLVEFSCTAGFPVLWSNLLTAHNVSFATFFGLLLLYMIIYQLDEMVIFGTVVVTLKASRLEERQGRILKLIGGSLMLTLAIVMLINPAIMNQLSTSLLVFGIAFGFAMLVLLLHRVVLPAFGIYIGTREGARRNKRKNH